jgi:hypothetical protein
MHRAKNTLQKWGKIKKLANPNLSRIALLCGTNSLLEEQLGNGC